MKILELKEIKIEVECDCGCVFDITLDNTICPTCRKDLDIIIMNSKQAHTIMDLGRNVGLKETVSQFKNNG